MSRSAKTLNYQTRVNLYIKLSQHPRFEKLSERQQELIDFLAAGGTSIAIANLWGVTDSMTWLIRNQALRILGFNIVENGKVRVMKVWEVWERIK